MSYYKKISEAIGAASSGRDAAVAALDFAALVSEVDKSKYVLRQTIARKETLYKAKLQEYFG